VSQAAHQAEGKFRVLAAQMLAKKLSSILTLCDVVPEQGLTTVEHHAKVKWQRNSNSAGN